MYHRAAEPETAAREREVLVMVVTLRVADFLPMARDGKPEVVRVAMVPLVGIRLGRLFLITKQYCLK